MKLPQISQLRSYLPKAMLVLGVLAGLAFAYNRFWPKPAIVATPQVAPEARKAEDIPKEVVAGPAKLVVYNRKKIVNKIPLPPEVANNPQNQFVSTAQIMPSPYGGATTTFVNMSTGQAGTVYTPKERPLFGFGGKTGIGLLGGISNRGDVALGYISQEVLRIGPANLGVAGGGGKIGTESTFGAVIHIHGQF